MAGTVSRGFLLMKRLLALSCVVPVLTGCGSAARLPVSSGVGPHPELGQPERLLIPTVNVVTAIWWAPGEMPVAAAGMEVVAFARGLQHPRWLWNAVRREYRRRRGLSVLGGPD